MNRMRDWQIKRKWKWEKSKKKNRKKYIFLSMIFFRLHNKLNSLIWNYAERDIEIKQIAIKQNLKLKKKTKQQNNDNNW